MLTQPQKHIPGWQEVLDAYQTIEGDPELLAAGKDILLLLLLRSITGFSHSWNFIDEHLECLKKYGVILHPVKKRIRSGTEEVEKRKRKDWIEACALTFILDLLTGQMGRDPAVQNFLCKLKILFWHKNQQRYDERCCVVFKHGKKTYRVCIYWRMIDDCRLLSLRKPPAVKDSYIGRIAPEISTRIRDLQPGYTTNCHHSIQSGDLNVFVLYALSSRRPLKKADFWGILSYERFDFLEYLLIDLPDKRLPYSLEDLMFIAFFAMPKRSEKSTLELLRLIEKASPGMISGISDRFGGNPLWYSLLALREKPETNADGTMKLPPIQHFLYGLCDHAKPNCDGISFDDMCRYYPSKFLGPWFKFR